MPVEEAVKKPKILVFATDACAYRGADYVGQLHIEYPTNIYIIRLPAPVIFPVSFYLESFEKGIDGIIVMTCGHECPYPGAYERTSERIDQAQQRMKERGMAPARLRLCAVCTVCARAFIKEVNMVLEACQNPT